MKKTSLLDLLLANDHDKIRRLVGIGLDVNEVQKEYGRSLFYGALVHRTGEKV